MTAIGEPIYERRFVPRLSLIRRDGQWSTLNPDEAVSPTVIRSADKLPRGDASGVQLVDHTTGHRLHYACFLRGRLAGASAAVEAELRAAGFGGWFQSVMVGRAPVVREMVKPREVNDAFAQVEALSARVEELEAVISSQAVG